MFALNDAERKMKYGQKEKKHAFAKMDITEIIRETVFQEDKLNTNKSIFKEDYNES